MKATIGLCHDAGVNLPPVLKRIAFGQSLKPWVARIVGLDTHYEFERVFLDGSNDYSQADKKGRGTKRWYILEPGIYEVKDVQSRYKERRYFLMVNEDGSMQEISKEQAMDSVGFKFIDQSVEFCYRHLGVAARAEGVTIDRIRTPIRWRVHPSTGYPKACYALVLKKTPRLKATYVAKEHRGKGIGRAIIQDAMATAREAGYTQLEALVYKPKAYQEAGWEVLSEKPSKFGTVYTVKVAL